MIVAYNARKGLLNIMVRAKDDEVIKKINPRSTGEVTAQVYSKYSEEISLEQEARELERCEELSLHTKYIFTAELISYNKENNLLTTKRIYGEELFLTLWNPTSLLGKLRGKRLLRPDLVRSRFSDLGSWLSLYHKSTSCSGDSEQAASWLKDSFNSKLDGIRDNRLLPVKKIDKIQQYLLREVEQLKRADYLAENSIRLCRIHGDFIIYNMLIDEYGNIHIIDFGDTRFACNIDDVARFYSNLWAIAYTNNWRKSMFLGFADDFLASYGLDSKVVETPYFKLIMTYNFLIHLYGHHCMRDLLSFVSNMELNQITRAGLKWIDENIY